MIGPFDDCQSCGYSHGFGYRARLVMELSDDGRGELLRIVCLWVRLDG